MRIWIYHLLQSYKSEGLNVAEACIRVSRLLGYRNLKLAGIEIGDIIFLYKL